MKESKDNPILKKNYICFTKVITYLYVQNEM